MLEERCNIRPQTGLANRVPAGMLDVILIVVRHAYSSILIVLSYQGSEKLILACRHDSPTVMLVTKNLPTCQ